MVRTAEMLIFLHDPGITSSFKLIPFCPRLAAWASGTSSSRESEDMQEDMQAEEERRQISCPGKVKTCRETCAHIEGDMLVFLFDPGISSSVELIPLCPRLAALTIGSSSSWDILDMYKDMRAQGRKKTNTMSRESQDMQKDIRTYWRRDTNTRESQDMKEDTWAPGREKTNNRSRERHAEGHAHQWKSR